MNQNKSEVCEGKLHWRGCWFSRRRIGR